MAVTVETLGLKEYRSTLLKVLQCLWYFWQTYPCLVPRPLFVFRLSVLGHVVRAVRSSWIRHRNELTVRAWENSYRNSTLL